MEEEAVECKFVKARFSSIIRKYSRTIQAHKNLNTK